MDIPRSEEFLSFTDVPELEWHPDTSMIPYEIDRQNPTPFDSGEFKPVWNSEVVFWFDGERATGKFLDSLFEDHPVPTLKILLGWRVEIHGEAVNIPRAKLGAWGYVPK
jgi:hypothetical protein